MMVDLVSGNVTNIRVKDQDFEVVKHIHASLILFGIGTHVFVVCDKDGKHHILKDAWLLVDHGISEVKVLSQIHKPPNHMHRRVVTGPVGDPLTTFCSRKEFVQVILDCVKWLDFLHNKCKLVHGDLSINNIVIFHTPTSHPPSKAPASKKGTNNPNIVTQITRGASRQVQAMIVPAPLAGVDDVIPVVGTIIDYDYARALKTLLERTSGMLPFMPLDALNIDNHGNYIHELTHDLEALLQTALGVITFTDGPCGKRGPLHPRIPLS
ncbi:hypothetical protein HYPSUDRAFT_69143 [Hypholoma sublateritium FD-334 SS-4]|uniref:Fungal-type protein kinase domain-containing protein n=1 Tax=Hypholoma sublateritium (strain FD-334 SS-4) TaxID=945553 RepID=A0A0D2NL22_HYPSF|nr:hypothetical protein HYPSUDRAFT_69143 [Hypholoma sublateritium FD-334 SS-4]